MHTTVDEHAAHVRGMLAFDRGTETVPLQAALARVTARAILSPRDLPLFRNSQMDGFAVRAADLEVSTTLPIVGVVPARAAAPAPRGPGTAIRIMTGAVVPEGADAVVPVEDTTVTGQYVTIARARRAGEYVRDRGSDVSAGDELLPARQLLASRHLAVLAAAGIAEVEVVRRVRVAVITTGSEVRRPGEDVELGQVYDANQIALSTAALAAGAEVVQSRHVIDEQALLLAVLAEAAGSADLILTSGGISKGDFEVVRELLEPRGAAIEHLAMQPGGPQATAVFDGVPVICFPGNPVSTQLSFEVFVAPVLREHAGLPARRETSRPLGAALESAAGKRQYLRAQLDGDGAVRVSSGPGSHLVAGLAAADALVVVPEQVTSLATGEMVEVWEL
jgi:molybdopterin molybdotransferase